jgi:Family of unknown function (DUF6011)
MSRYVSWKNVTPVAATIEEREAVRLVNDAQDAIDWEKRAPDRQREIERCQKYLRKHPESKRDEELIAWYSRSRQPAIGASLHSVGMYEDGRLYNPYGYPEDIVRRAVEPIYTKWKEERDNRRKEGAAKAAVTRKRRHEKLIHAIAAKVVRDEKTGPSDFCILCKKAVTDPASIERGIGSDCWQGVLDSIERQKAAATKAAA